MNVRVRMTEGLPVDFTAVGSWQLVEGALVLRTDDQTLIAILAAGQWRCLEVLA